MTHSVAESPALPVAAIQQKLTEGTTWDDLSEAEKERIVEVLRAAGRSWRAIAEEVGKPREKHSTIYKWVCRNCPRLLTKTSIAPPNARKKSPEEKFPINETAKSMVLAPPMLTRLEEKLQVVETLARQLEEHLAKQERDTPPGVQALTSTAPPPPPPAPLVAGNASPPTPAAVTLSPTQPWQEYDWSPATIAQLSQPEIERIPAAILETLPTTVLTQLNERMAELQRLAAMSPEEREAYLQRRAEEEARAEIAQQKTNELEDHALFQRARTQWDDSAVGGRGRLGQWDRQLEYWYCLTCKQRFPFERRRNGRVKPEKCPECYARDIEPWAPGEEVTQEMSRQGE